MKDIFKRVTEPSNYKFLINSLGSKNQDCVTKVLAILKEAGGIEERIQDYDKSQVISNIVQIYLKRSNNDNLRQQSLELIAVLAKNSD